MTYIQHLSIYNKLNHLIYYTLKKKETFHNFARCVCFLLCEISVNSAIRNIPFNRKLFDQVARKLAMVEADLERAEERAELGEK